MRRTRRQFLGAAAVAGLAGCATSTAGQTTPDGYRTVRVPDDYPTVQDGVDAADEGDLVLVEAGTYEEAVEVTTPGVTLRGTDRNDVVLDGGFERSYGVDIEADGVAVENLTVRHYAADGVYWSGVEGFRGSYLTAYNNVEYGVYASGSRDGRFEYSYASGHRDAGFYLGGNRPFETVIADVVAERNAMGYSGTSAGGDLTVRDSVWANNMAGIVPNTLAGYDEPQRDARIVDNVVVDNANADAPSKQLTFPTFGSGIVVWGGHDNLIDGNFVSGHEHFGIAVVAHEAESAGNLVRGNLVRDSGAADLALGARAGEGNRFEHNGFATSWPAAIEPDPGGGDERVTEVFDRQERRAERGDFPAGDPREQPEPGDQPPMPDPTAPPRPASKSGSWGPEGS